MLQRTQATFLLRTDDDTPDPAERLALHLLGKLAMDMHLTRAMIDPERLTALIDTLTEGIREGLESLTSDEREDMLPPSDRDILRDARATRVDTSGLFQRQTPPESAEGEGEDDRESDSDE